VKRRVAGDRELSLSAVALCPQRITILLTLSNYIPLAARLAHNIPSSFQSSQHHRTAEKKKTQ
jgi:hypothetical protein